MLYVPAGFPHTTDTAQDKESDETSIHLTVGEGAGGRGRGGEGGRGRGGEGGRGRRGAGGGGSERS
eukprot:756504-Hanusia_phi.AAC.1